MLTFAAAVFFLIITPGPGVLSLAGVGASYGRRAALAYLGGLMLGNNLVIAAVVSGLAALILADPVLRWVLMGLSTAYLLYLAAKVAFAGARVGFIHPERAPGFRNGLLLQFINPKAYAVNTAMFAGLPLGLSLMAEVPLKLIIVNAIWLPIHLLWLWAGIRIEQMELPPTMQHRVNLAMGLSLVIVVGLSVCATLRTGMG